MKSFIKSIILSEVEWQRWADIQAENIWLWSGVIVLSPQSLQDSSAETPRCVRTDPQEQAHGRLVRTCGENSE